MGATALCRAAAAAIPAGGRRLIASAGLLALLAASVVLALDAAAGPSMLVPGGRQAFPAWLAGPLAGLGRPTSTAGLGRLLVMMLAGWLAVLAGARTLPPRWLLAGIAAAHVAFLLAPPLLSADVFGYIGFARLGVVHHLDPYVFGTGWAPHDQVHPYLRWRNAHTPYGPLFTVLSYGLVPLGVAGALWTFKALACAASLATVALVWRIGARRGRDARRAAVLVGLSPPLLAFEVAGGHNDALVMLAAVAGVGLVLERREHAGVGLVVVAAALKVTGGILAPFALIGSRDRRRAGVAALVAAGLVLGLTLTAFSGGGVLAAMVQPTSDVALHSVPSTLARALGTGGVDPHTRLLLAAAVGVCLIGLLVRAWRGHDWIACAGWATLAVLCGSTWLLPWYATWLTPLAALGDSARLRAATVLLVVFLTLTRVSFLPL